MSRLLDVMIAVARGAGIILCATGMAHGQEAIDTHLPTIADCPPGYVLAVEDTAEPQPVASATINTSPDNTDTSAAPRRFVTGCVAPQQNQRQER